MRIHRGTAPVCPRPRLSWLPLVLALAIAGCGDDNGFGNPDDVDFPALDAATLAEFCIRGNVVPPASPSGTLARSDCGGEGPGIGFWEVFRLRVGAAGRATFEADASFDSYLELLRIDDLADIENSAVLIAEDDDSGPGLQALLSADLSPGIEYVIVISGFDDTELGDYTIRID